jgi:hypothetical protein
VRAKGRGEHARGGEGEGRGKACKGGKRGQGKGKGRGGEGEEEWGGRCADLTPLPLPPALSAPPPFDPASSKKNRYMIDLQPTSRHMLTWLMNLMEPLKDQLYLAVGKAYEPNGAVSLSQNKYLG